MSAAAQANDFPPPYGRVVFDCDSTLCAIEGVDELASIAGVERARIEGLTARAMAGEVALEAVYGARLEALRPDRTALEELGRRYLAALLPHARELCRALHALGKEVFIVSGGLRQALEPVARALEVDAEHLHAVEVFLDRHGRYAGFDELSPLARAGGKLEVLRGIARQDRGGGVALVGDGATDLEAAAAVRRFVAFAGVVERPAVAARARCVARSRDLAHLAPLLISEAEAERLSATGHAAFVRLGFQGG